MKPRFKLRSTRHEVKVIYQERELTVVFMNYPEEPSETGPEAQYPGCPEHTEIEEINEGDKCVFDEIDHDDIQLMIDEEDFEYVKQLS